LTLLAALVAGAPAEAAQPFAMPGRTAQPATSANPEPVSPDASAAAAAETFEQPGFLSRFLYRAMSMQQDYYRGLAKAFRAFNLEHSLAAAGALMSLSFAYGIFHAVGPGHGKIVVTSYLLADERDVKRGVAMAFLSSFAQAVTAIVAVGALAILLGLTHRAVAEAVPLIERGSFILVAAVGAALLWRALRPAHGHDHAHTHDHGDHHHGHAHDRDHEDHAGHAHMPTPEALRAAHGWRDMAAIVLAVGLRPCTGAVLVLLFALTQGAFLVGALSALAMSVGTAITVSALAVLTLASKNLALRVAGTADNPWTLRIERGLKIAGGVFILTMGLFMLAGSFYLPPQPLM
jgi:ABC-type nickel/cobalt efflux system permease component RcnA